MNFRFIFHDLYANIKAWTRSPGTVFWSILFPVLLILIFGAIFSNTGDYEAGIVVQNLDEADETGFTENFTKTLDEIPALDIKMIDKNIDITEYMQDEGYSSALQIPEGFGKKISEYIAAGYNPSIKIDNDSFPFNLTLFTDPSDQTTTSIVRTVLIGVIHEFNMRITGGESIIGVNEENTYGEEFSYIDFFVPGMIGFTIMTSMIYGSIERNTKYRKDGILRKLLTMPITRAEWILAKMLFMLFLSFLSTIVIILVGVLAWGLNININAFFILLVIATSFMFSGMGMIIGRFVKDQEVADMAGGAITFPMMFLAGTFFPLEQMPQFMQSIAQVLPLYYVNEAFRNAMIRLDFDKTIYFTSFVLVFAIVFFILGVLLTKWKED